MPRGSVSFAIVARDPSRWISGPMALAGLCLLAAVAVRLSGLDHAGISFCYFKALTGRACLTCGTTRAFGHLARFDLGSALAVQPLATIGAVVLIAWGVLDAALLVTSRRTRIEVHGASTPRALFAVVIGLALLNWTYLLATGV